MADDREVKIPISIPGAGQAAIDTRQVGDAFAKLGKDVKQAGADTRTAAAEQEKAAKGASKGLNELGEATEKGASAGRILREVLSGNIYALGQLGAVLKGLGAFLKGNPWGAAMTVLAAGFAFVPSILRSLGLLKDKVEEVGPAAEGAGKKVEEAFADSGKAFEQLTRDLAELRDRYDAVTQEVNRLRSAQDALDDQKLALDLAGIDLREAEALRDPSMPPEERRRIKAEFSLERESRRQEAAETRALEQTRRTQGKLAEVDARRAGNVNEQEALQIDEGRIRGALGELKQDRARLQELIGGQLEPGVAPDGLEAQARRAAAVAGGVPGIPRGPDRVSERDPALIKQAEEELKALEQRIKDNEALLEKITRERAEAMKRDRQLGSEREVAATEAEVASRAYDATRLRATVDNQRAANSRQEANKAAVDAATGGDGVGLIPGLGIPIPELPPSQPGRVTRESFDQRPKDYEAIARAMLESGERNGKAIAEEMLRAVREHDEKLRSSFRAEIERINRLEAQVRNGREGK